MRWEAVIGAGAIVPLLAAAISLAVPTAVAAAGECVAERSGILNLGLEGMMLTGALGGFVGAYYADRVAVGVLAGIAAGVLLAIAVGLLVVRFKINQVVVGVTTVILATGLTSYIYFQLFGLTSNPPQLAALPTAGIPFLRDVPALGEVLFQQDVLTYIGLAVPFLMWWVLFRTRFGLAVRSVGERPDAADANGVAVDRIRWIALLIAGAAAGLGGAILVVGDVNLFRENITAGRGWIAIAMVIFARWHPIGALGGSLLFGFATALQLRIQAAGGGIESNVPYEVFQALPYIVTFLVVTAATIRFRRNPQPSALGVAFTKTK